MTFLLVRSETSGPRVRLYCEMLPALLVGVQSTNRYPSFIICSFTLLASPRARFAAPRCIGVDRIVASSGGDLHALRRGPQMASFASGRHPKRLEKPEKKMAGTRRLRPSLNREASRLRDVRVRRPSSRALVPETIIDSWEPSEAGRDRSSRAPKMAVSAHHYQTEFLLARLQKAQRSETQSNSAEYEVS